MDRFLEEIARAWRHLDPSVGPLVVVFLWAAVLTAGVVALIRRRTKPGPSQRGEIGWTLSYLLLAGLNVGNATSHVHIASFWRPLTVAVGAGFVLGLGGPPIARLLRLPQLALAVGGLFARVFSTAARLVGFLLAPLIHPVSALVRQLPPLSAFRVAMIAVLSACAGLIGMVAYSFARG